MQIGLNTSGNDKLQQTCFNLRELGEIDKFVLNKLQSMTKRQCALLGCVAMFCSLLTWIFDSQCSGDLSNTH